MKIRTPGDPNHPSKATRNVLIAVFLLLVLATAIFCPGALAQSPVVTSDPAVPPSTEPTIYYWWQSGTLTLAARNITIFNLDQKVWFRTYNDRSWPSSIGWEIHPDGSLRWSQYIPIWDVGTIWLQNDVPFIWTHLPNGYPSEWDVVIDPSVGMRRVLQLMSPRATIWSFQGHIGIETNRYPGEILSVRYRDNSSDAIDWNHDDTSWFVNFNLNNQWEFYPYLPTSFEVTSGTGITRLEDTWYRALSFYQLLVPLVSR